MDAVQDGNFFTISLFSGWQWRIYHLLLYHKDARFFYLQICSKGKIGYFSQFWNIINLGQLQHLVMIARVILNVLQSLALFTDQCTRLALWTELGGRSLGINKHLTVMMRVSSINTLIQNPVAVCLVALCLSQTQNRPEIALEWSLLYIDVFTSLLIRWRSNRPVIDARYYHTHFLLTLTYVTWSVHNVVSLSNWLFTNRHTIGCL